MLLILLFQDKTSTVPEESVNLSIVAVPRLITQHENLIGEHGAAGDLAQGAMGTAATSTPPLLSVRDRARLQPGSEWHHDDHPGQVLIYLLFLSLDLSLSNLIYSHLI